MMKHLNYSYSTRPERPAAKPASAVRLALVGSAILVLMMLVEQFFK